MKSDIYQIKSYAKGVGEVQVASRGDAESIEELELVEHTQLSPDALAAVRALALELEAHAYEVSKDAYGDSAFPVVASTERNSRHRRRRKRSDCLPLYL